MVVLPRVCCLALDVVWTVIALFIAFVLFPSAQQSGDGASVISPLFAYF